MWLFPIEQPRPSRPDALSTQDSTEPSLRRAKKCSSLTENSHGDPKCSSCTGKFFLQGVACKPHTNCDALGRVQNAAGTNTADAICGDDKKCTCSNGVGGIAERYVALEALGRAGGVKRLSRSHESRCALRPVPTL